jgi:hypothetical protein
VRRVRMFSKINDNQNRQISGEKFSGTHTSKEHVKFVTGKGVCSMRVEMS